mmetsp:Transcript_107/g.359  ORF Transcript_107/g.359 Transcript_107/m.359 type:complete len:361 (-) Transcript_107:134-1216(-)
MGEDRVAVGAIAAVLAPGGGAGVGGARPFVRLWRRIRHARPVLPLPRLVALRPKDESLGATRARGPRTLGAVGPPNRRLARAAFTLWRVLQARGPRAAVVQRRLDLRPRQRHVDRDFLFNRCWCGKAAAAVRVRFASLRRFGYRVGRVLGSQMRKHDQGQGPRAHRRLAPPARQPRGGRESGSFTKGAGRLGAVQRKRPRADAARRRLELRARRPRLRLRRRPRRRRRRTADDVCFFRRLVPVRLCDQALERRAAARRRRRRTKTPPPPRQGRRRAPRRRGGGGRRRRRRRRRDGRVARPGGVGRGARRGRAPRRARRGTAAAAAAHWGHAHVPGQGLPPPRRRPRDGRPRGRPRRLLVI